MLAWQTILLLKHHLTFFAFDLRFACFAPLIIISQVYAGFSCATYIVFGKYVIAAVQFGALDMDVCVCVCVETRETQCTDLIEVSELNDSSSSAFI